MKVWKYILCIVGCGLSRAVTAYADSPQEYGCELQACGEAACCDQLTYSPLRINVAGVAGKGMGDDNQNAAASIFYAPAVCVDWQPFIDLRGHNLKSGGWVANGGLGVRWLSSCDRTFGANIFYDYRNYRSTGFGQVGVGLESLGETVDFRINGYLPFNKRISDVTVFDDYIGDFIVEASQFWSPMRGIDAEVGVTLLNNGTIGLYAACGPYYYRTVNNPGHVEAKDTFGGMARFSIQWTEYVQLEVKATYDHLFNTKVQGLLQLTLPFDACFNVCGWAKKVDQNIFLKPVERRDVMVLYNSGVLWEGNY